MRSFTGGPSLTTQYAYDVNGNQETMTYPDGRVVTYSYDATGRVSGVTSVKDGTSKTFASNVRYLPFGPVASYTYGNGLTVQATYDMDYRLTHLKSGPMLRWNYGYDDNGNITSINDVVHPEKNQTFTYDALDRLRTVSGAYGNLTYDYDDAVGNRIGGGDELVYDENGNVIGDGALEFEYGPGAPVGYNPGTGEVGIYGYAGGNPVILIDSNGLLARFDAGFGGGNTSTLTQDKSWEDMTGQERYHAWMDYETKKQAGIPVDNPFTKWTKGDDCFLKCAIETAVGYPLGKLTEEAAKRIAKQLGSKLLVRIVPVVGGGFLVVDAIRFNKCYKNCTGCK